MNVDMICAGWSNVFRTHASLFRIVDGNDINYRMNLENSFTGKVATRWYDDRGVAEREMRDILYDGMIRTELPGEKVKIWANGDWESGGEIKLKGNNRIRIRGARNSDSY